MKQKVTEVINGRIPPNISYSESDQSPVYGEEALLLDMDLGSGMDYYPNYPHLSEWLKTMYRGDYEKFLDILRVVPEEEVKVLLTKRETFYNVPAVFHPVYSASLMFNDDRAQDKLNLYKQRINAKDGHLKILIKLLSLGVDVNARDVGGRTPLHHCSQGHYRMHVSHLPSN